MPLHGCTGVRITIRTFDLDQTVAFYRDALGLTEKERFASGVILGVDGVEIALIGQEDAPARADGMFSLGFRVQDIEAVHRQLGQAHCDIDDIVEKPWGTKQFIVRGPNGVTVFITQWRA